MTVARGTLSPGSADRQESAADVGIILEKNKERPIRKPTISGFSSAFHGRLVFYRDKSLWPYVYCRMFSMTVKLALQNTA